MTTPYRPVTWTSGDPGTKTKFAQMAVNDQYLFETSPKTYYNAHGFKRDRGIKILSGIAAIPANNTQGSGADVDFGNYFSVGCRPVITMGVQTDQPLVRYFTSVRGFGTAFPDHRGFNLKVQCDDEPNGHKIRYSIYVYWTAIGY